MSRQFLELGRRVAAATYHTHAFNGITVLAHRHEGDSELHTHAEFTADGTGWRTPGAATPLDDLEASDTPREDA